MRTAYSKMVLQGLGGASWLAGAGVAAGWMLNGGGIARPVAFFAAWAMAVSGIFFYASDEREVGRSKMGLTVTVALCGAVSVILLLLGTLFMEFWPVTLSTAFLFAICRTFKSEDDPAYS